MVPSLPVCLHLDRHLAEKDRREDIVARIKEVSLEAIRRDGRPLHRERDAVEADEEEDAEVEPLLASEI